MAGGHKGRPYKFCFMLNIYEQIDINKRKSALVIALFIVFIVAFAYVLGLALESGISLIPLALIFSGGSAFVSYYWGDKMILSISRAKPATREEHFDFYTAAENLCMVAQIPVPKLYVINDTAMNAFATGRDPEHATVCATSGLLDQLDRSELEGVVAHELSHVRHYDIRLMSLVVVLVGMVTLLADWFLRGTFRVGGRRRGRSNAGQLIAVLALLSALLAPIVAKLIQLAISRRREFLADAGAVMLTRYPDGLVRALQKISMDQEPLEAANKATAHLYISNPLKNLHKGVGVFAKMFNTHPPVKERIAALKAMM